MMRSVFKGGLRAAITATCLCLPLAVLADEAPADIPAIEPAAPTETSAPLPLRLERDAKAPTHRIVIPTAVLAKLAGELPGAAHIASITPVRSIVAAVALAAAVACGLVVSRRGRPGRLAAAVLWTITLTGTGALLLGGPALADRAPSGPPRPADVDAQEFLEIVAASKPRRPAADAPASVTLAQGGKVVIEIAADGEDVVLVVGENAE
jgi:hypothetical protein